jgi:hypothetical protein
MKEFRKKSTEKIKIIVEGKEYEIEYHVLSKKQQKKLNKKLLNYLKRLDKATLTIQKALSLIDDDKKLEEFISLQTDEDVVKAIQLEKQIKELKKDELNNIDKIYDLQEELDNIREKMDDTIKEFKREAFRQMIVANKELEDYFVELDEEDTLLFNEYVAEVYKDTRMGKLRK